MSDITNNIYIGDECGKLISPIIPGNINNNFNITTIGTGNKFINTNGADYYSLGSLYNDGNFNSLSGTPLYLSFDSVSKESEKYITITIKKLLHKVMLLSSYIRNRSTINEDSSELNLNINEDLINLVRDKMGYNPVYSSVIAYNSSTISYSKNRIYRNYINTTSSLSLDNDDIYKEYNDLFVSIICHMIANHTSNIYITLNKFSISSYYYLKAFYDSVALYHYNLIDEKTIGNPSVKSVGDNTTCEFTISFKLESLINNIVNKIAKN